MIGVTARSSVSVCGMEVYRVEPVTAGLLLLASGGGGAGVEWVGRYLHLACSSCIERVLRLPASMSMLKMPRQFTCIAAWALRLPAPGCIIAKSLSRHVEYPAINGRIPLYLAITLVPQLVCTSIKTDIKCSIRYR